MCLGTTLTLAVAAPCQGDIFYPSIGTETAHRSPAGRVDEGAVNVGRCLHATVYLS